jgi:hypothetical protein
VEETIHKRLYLVRNELEAAAEAAGANRDHTMRKALEELLVPIRLAADTVEPIERYRPGEWYRTDDPVARRMYEIVTSLERAWRMTKAGRLTGERFMAVARKMIDALKPLLVTADPENVRRLDDEGASSRRRSEDVVDAYTWKNGVPVLTPRYAPEANRLDREVFDAEFRRLFGRPPGRPKVYRDEVQTVLDAIVANPGMSVRALCKATRMKTAMVTKAYKQLVADHQVREERGPHRSTLLFPVFPLPPAKR